MAIFDQLQQEAERQHQQLRDMDKGEHPILHLSPTQKSTQEFAQPRDLSRDNPRGKLPGKHRGNPRALPSRDEIQELSFRIRDEWKVKVQAEIPRGWQDELEDLARKLNVGKLELYRFIIGEFLGKVQRKGETDTENR